MKNVLIIGYGVVGQNLAKELSKLKPDIVDKFKSQYNTIRDIKYDFAFICVDTPYTEKDICDTKEVKNALMEYLADIYIIKSTVLPSTTSCLAYACGKKIVFSPEYYGGTQHCNNFNFDFTILGGDKKDCYKVQQLLQEVYDARHSFHITDSTTAELTKYMENSFLATKVTFCTQFYEIAKTLGVDYEELRELFVLDNRVGKSHTFVYDEHPYWESHCLDKDVVAIAEQNDAGFLKAVIKFNQKQKNKYKELKDEKIIFSI